MTSQQIIYKTYLCKVIFVDTHTHLYLNAFDEDRNQVVERALKDDIHYLLLPNIDCESAGPLLSLCEEYPSSCFPMMGLHPTSVGVEYEKELDCIQDMFREHQYIAVGETGIDLYWDKTFIKEQEAAFRLQIDIALVNDLPIVIHSRDSFMEIMGILSDYRNSGLKGVFHCFTGTKQQADEVIELGFMLGIGGVVTFKNSGLDRVVENIDPSHLLLETDSPFLAPVPYRGKRNESAYIQLIANKLGQIKGMSKEEIAKITSENAKRLFNIGNNA